MRDRGDLRSRPRKLRKRAQALITATAIAALVAPALAPAQKPQPPATPELNFAAPINPKPCTYDSGDEVEKKSYEVEGWDPATDYERYPGSCQRMRFAYGPIAVKPGQNDVLVGPVTIEKPIQDGYITRIKPNLTRVDGTVPPVHEVHLHHGTWLNSTDNYGDGPFFAAGEEKTIAPFPRGYGMPVKATDLWQLLYMVHSAVQQPMEVFITYEIDFIPASAPAAQDMKPAYPLWLDVRPSSYPVFNVQRSFGGDDGECTWPTEECAAFNSFGQSEVGQGEPGNGIGRDESLPDEGEAFGRVPSFTGGTIIGLGGHLHPGGLRNEVDLVRDGQAKRIYTGIPTYWDPEDTTKGGGPPDSWDFSMRVNGLPNWGVHVEPGDVLRSNAAYDTTLQDSYENMGIVVALLVPEDDDGNKQAPGVNPFDAPVDDSGRCDSGGLLAETPTLCPNGMLETHGHYKENGYRGGPAGEWTAPSNGPASFETTEIGIANFLYLPGDLTQVDALGVPKVPLGSDLRFTNLDGAAVLHTVTTCKFPCLGPTGAAFPLGDGETSKGTQVELDSGQLGFSVPEISGAKNELTWATPVSDEQYEAGEIVTYYCRIHPSMRGAFEVTE
ncbi:MAG TPA: hypothetical protein VD790_06730 [Thermoleophilaceae bacterium]|nr:hypothetical protein [Thermoleophilaceae bacterium]